MNNNRKTKYAAIPHAELMQRQAPITALHKAAKFLGRRHSLWTDKMALACRVYPPKEDARDRVLEGVVTADGIKDGTVPRWPAG